jgi:divalent metal cation (Fe/Co/Zn/Cd) transporter
MKKGVYVMKKLISLLLVVMMLFTAVNAFAESGRSILSRFLKETDTKTKDIALQLQNGEKSTDLVIRVDRDNLHLV